MIFNGLRNVGSVVWGFFVFSFVFGFGGVGLGCFCFLVDSP